MHAPGDSRGYGPRDGSLRAQPWREAPDLFWNFMLIGFALTCTLFDAAVRRWGAKWGVRSIADPAGLPLLVLILSTFIFVLTPFLNTVVRVTEREADAFGINTAREPDGMAKVALKLGAYRKLDPTPLEEFIFFDHPSGRARIRMAMDWKTANLPAANRAQPQPSQGLIEITRTIRNIDKLLEQLRLLVTMPGSTERSLRLKLILSSL